MKKLHWWKLCLLVGILLIIVFIIAVIRDYAAYNTTLNSAPFSLWIWVNGICYLLPAAILFLAAFLLKKKQNKAVAR